MVRKRLDDRVRTLLEKCVISGERSMLVMVGDHGKDQVANLHQILTKCTVQTRPSVLWCYKKELGFSTHKMKRMKKLKKQKARGLQKDSDQADNFELFVSQTDVTWCYYRDSHRVLGRTYGMLVLQDFEALTPNLLARTIETVSGGGLVIFLLRTVKSLKQLYAMSMDVHSRYRTDSAGDIVPRFNERFILSLGDCPNCLVCDDELNVLPISRRTLRQLEPSRYPKGESGELLMELSAEEQELNELQESLIDTPHIGVLVELSKTLDQAKALLVFLEACSEKKQQSTTVALTAARGRGKSAALGLCLAGAISLGYSNIAVTAPEPENLVSVFDFVCRGLKALKFQEHMDYTVTYNNASGREAIKCILSVTIHRTHRQVIQYIPPGDTDKFNSSEIVAVDEAAAIPLPSVRALMHQQAGRITFLSSTVNGYEGTGRALSLKLIKELRESKSGRAVEMQVATAAATAIVGSKTKKGDFKVHEQRYAAASAAIGEASSEHFSGQLREIELSTPIRYAQGDPIEAWLNNLLCLDCGSSSSLKLVGGAPAPLDCELYSVDRDALFSYHKLSEAFLQKVMGLYTSAHYKNTPNDLQMLSDAPAHSIFVLLSPSAEQDADSLPDVLAVIQVALEGKISRKTVEAQLARGHRSAGDLIPWTISQQFGDSKFAQLSGARIVRLAVHPSVQGMGYGSRAIECLYRYYNGEMVHLVSNDDDESEISARDASGEEESDHDLAGVTGILGENLKPRKELPPLLLPLTEIEPPRLDWIGTSFGLTHALHKFWSRAQMRLLYLRQTKNDLTGEHSAIMLRSLPRQSGVDDVWLPLFMNDTRRRIIALLGGAFRNLDLRLAVSILESFGPDTDNGSAMNNAGRGKITADELDVFLTPHDLKRLELYGRNLCDHHLVADLLPSIAQLYFTERLGNDLQLSSVQAALLCGIGLQHRTVDSLTSDLKLPGSQVLAMFNKAVRKISLALNNIVEAKEKEHMLGGEKREAVENIAERMRDVSEKTLVEDTEEAAQEAIEKLNAAVLPPEITTDQELMQYVVKGSNDQWARALQNKKVDGELQTVRIQSFQDKVDKSLSERGEKRKLDKLGKKSKKNGKSKRISKTRH
jgi:N-acetyltransferase 10